jgi:hypothetical protein
MKPTAPDRTTTSVLVTTPCRGYLRLVRSMREPWLFWGSLAVVPFAIACLLIAMRVTSERLTRALEVAGEIILGVALPLAGYEGGFRYPAKDIWELKTQTSAGLLFITLGIICIADVIAKAFDK